jgi:hypothetical protein
MKFSAKSAAARQIRLPKRGLQMCVPPIHTGTLINDLVDIAAKQARIDEIDREYAQLLHADIRKYRQCQACEGGGENPPQCGQQAIPGTEFCLQHTVE